MPSLKDLLKKNEIIRRYVVMNSFDGSLTVLGIIIALYISGITEATLIIISNMGAIIATGVSGIWGGYAAEKAEQTRSIKELERHLMRKLKETRIEKISRKLSLVMGLANGLSSTFVGLIIITPFFFANFGAISVFTAYLFSFGIIAFSLFVLGIFVGKIAKENVWAHGATMLLAGLLVGALVYVLELFKVV